MPVPADFPHRPWSTGFSLGFGPLWFDPNPAPRPTGPAVTGAKGSTMKTIGDQRPGSSVVQL